MEFLKKHSINSKYGLIEFKISAIIPNQAVDEDTGFIIQCDLEDRCDEILSKLIKNDPEVLINKQKMKDSLINLFRNKAIYIEDTYTRDDINVGIKVYYSLGPIQIEASEEYFSISWYNSIIKENAWDIFHKKGTETQGKIICTNNIEQAQKYLDILLK